MRSDHFARVIRSFTILSVSILLAACPGGNRAQEEQNNSGKVASTPLEQTPLNNNCLTGQQNCNSNLYQNFRGFGFRPYPINPYYYGGYSNYWSSYSGFGTYQFSYTMFCDCPMGTIPVYNNQYGLGCVARTVVSPFFNFIGYYNIPAANGHWVSIPQVSNQQYSPVRRLQTNSQRRPPAWNCHSRVAQSCFINQANSCHTGQHCRPTAGNSELGICVYR